MITSQGWAMFTALVNMECMYQWLLRYASFEDLKPEHARGAVMYGLMARGWGIAVTEVRMMEAHIDEPGDTNLHVN